MNRTGFMHNDMRMYWGKKVLEWSPTPRQIFGTVRYVNSAGLDRKFDMPAYLRRVAAPAGQPALP